MRILVQTHGRGIGGNETLIYQLARRLSDTHEFFITCAETTSAPFFAPVAPVFQATSAEFLSLLARLNPELIWCFHGDILRLAALGRKAGIPAWWIVGHPPSPDFSKIAAALFSNIIVQSRFLAETVRPYFEDLKTIYNGVDAEEFLPAPIAERRAVRCRLGLGEDDFVIGYAGRLRPYKRHGDLIQIFDRLRGKISNLRLLFFYPPEIEVDDYAQTMLKHSSDSIQFVGTTPSELRSNLSTLDCFINCAEAEGLGTTILEAMACEIPTISAESGGTEEIFEKAKSPLSFALGDIAHAATLVLQLFRDRQFAKFEAARQRDTIQKYFSIHKTEEYYRSEIQYENHRHHSRPQPPLLSA